MTARTCNVEGCERPHHAKGMCQSHYKRGREAEIRTHRFRDRPEMAEAERLLRMGLTVTEVAKLVDSDRWTIARNFPNRISPSRKYVEILPLVQQGLSFNEIRKTIGSDYRTVKKHFPHYRPFPPGGGGEAAEIKKANAMLRRIDDNGRLRSRRNNY